MKRTRAGVAVIAVGIVLGMHAQGPSPQSGTPSFEVDPSWPKVPDKWLFGEVSGVSVDAQDHVWLLNTPGTLTPAEKLAATNPPQAECCLPAPPVMEFDAAGNFIHGWGGPGAGYDWPLKEHGLHVDYRGNVWVGGNNDQDNQILKFSKSGQFLLQIGHKGQSKGSNDTENLNKAADIYVYPKTNEVFVADGYGNRRVIVFDADTGAYKRHWGAYGNKPDDSAPNTPAGAQQFNTVHGVRVSNDGLVYVADRRNNRVQVFTVEGKFVKEGFTSKSTGGIGAASGVAFSPDPQQRFLYVTDGTNGHVWLLNRQTLEIAGSFGRFGRQAGQFQPAHSIAVDSRGNIYVTEVARGSRAQKFTFKGLSPATHR